MTSSVTPTSAASTSAEPDANPTTFPTAKVHVRAGAERAHRIARWVVAGVVVLGWAFILGSNRFDLTMPVVVFGLAWLSVVLTGWWLVRTFLETAEHDLAGDEAWFRPSGALGELQREKASLLKAIKEIEFDRGMGKMTAADADELLALYRGKAIEVIKAIDAATVATSSTARAEIDRELRARLQVGAASRLGPTPGKGAAKVKAKAKGKASKSPVAPAAPVSKAATSVEASPPLSPAEAAARKAAKAEEMAAEAARLAEAARAAAEEAKLEAARVAGESGDGDARSGGEGDLETEAETETETETETGTETETETGTETEAETETEADSESKTGTETETDAAAASAKTVAS
jgi:hypothetical protein